MNENIEKYLQLLQTDETFREKLKAAAEAYTGERTEEAVFDNVLAPVIREYGITFTLDELKSYTESQAVQQLDLDELGRINGGEITGIDINGGGMGITVCTYGGIGLGAGGGSNGWGICVLIGYGDNKMNCLYAGNTSPR